MSVERLDLEYATANQGGQTSFEGMLDEWRFLPLAEVWCRRVAMPGSDPDDILFFKAIAHQYRLDLPFRPISANDAEQFAESIAIDFAKHRVKTDPAQIREAMGRFVQFPEEPVAVEAPKKRGRK